jgi:hypothetical protein
MFNYRLNFGKRLSRSGVGKCAAGVIVGRRDLHDGAAEGSSLARQSPSLFNLK